MSHEHTHESDGFANRFGSRVEGSPMRLSLVPDGRDEPVFRSNRPTQSVSDPIPGMMARSSNPENRFGPKNSGWSQSAENNASSSFMDTEKYHLDADHFARLLAGPEKSDTKKKREGIGSEPFGPNFFMESKASDDVSRKGSNLQGKTFIAIQVFEMNFPVSPYNVFDFKFSENQSGKFIWIAIEKALVSCNESGMSVDWIIEETRENIHECNGRVYDARSDSVDFQITLFQIRGNEETLMEIRRMSGAWMVHDNFVRVIVNALKETDRAFANVEKHQRDDDSDEFWAAEEEAANAEGDRMDFEMESHMDDSSIVSESLTDGFFADMPEMGETLPPRPLTSLNANDHGRFMGTARSSHSADECVQTLLDKDSYRDDIHECSMTLNGLTNDIGPARQVIGGLFAKHDGVQLCHHLIDSLLRPFFMDAHTSWHTAKAVSGLINHEFFPTLILVSKDRVVQSLIESINKLKEKWTQGGEFVMPSQSIVNECESILRKIDQIVRSIRDSS